MWMAGLWTIVWVNIFAISEHGKCRKACGWFGVTDCLFMWRNLHIVFFLRYMKPLCHIFDVDVLSTFAQKCKNMLTEKTCGKYRIPNSCNMEILSLWRSYIFFTNAKNYKQSHKSLSAWLQCFLSDLFHCTARDIGDTVMWNEIGWWNRIFFGNFNSASLSQRKFADLVCRNHKYFFLLIIYSMLCRGPRDGSLKS